MYTKICGSLIQSNLCRFHFQHLQHSPAENFNLIEIFFKKKRSSTEKVEVLEKMVFYQCNYVEFFEKLNEYQLPTQKCGKKVAVGGVSVSTSEYCHAIKIFGK